MQTRSGEGERSVTLVCTGRREAEWQWWGSGEWEEKEEEEEEEEEEGPVSPVRTLAVPWPAAGSPEALKAKTKPWECPLHSPDNSVAAPA
ncbi:hypothetical protein EYF80_035309 [Liparis tanakae]|uniref:Uncharacterized protein n=1 Tax=Liparis tanakae TaxID=230148 RepID=A0A4Z2GMM0_9TELE|nr:hypothetical protein EYF80_035309 [Liparis tanakae]